MVPITNARYALNAVNARWGSFYDALYGTDALGGLLYQIYMMKAEVEKLLNTLKKHLDKIAPLNKGSWNKINKIQKEKGELKFYF